MSYCPVPAQSAQTAFSDAKVTSNPKTPKFEGCEGGTTSQIAGPATSTTTTVCCPSPGPQGEAGCNLKWESAWVPQKVYNFNSGTPCYTSIITHQGVTYIAKATHQATGDFEPGIGDNWTQKWDIFSQMSGELRWKGTWTPDTDYVKNDVILAPTSGHTFVCMEPHTSISGDAVMGEPTPTNPTSNWQLMNNMGTWVPQKEKTFIEGLMDGVMDWWKDAPLWKKVLGVAAGIGVAIAGAKIVDMLSGNGDVPGGGSADARYTGSPGFNGTWTEPTLPVVVQSLMEFAGYAPEHIDVSLLPAKTVHFSLTGGMTTRAVLQQLALTYQFDVVPSSGKVKFVPKYSEPVRTLTFEDLGHKTQDLTSTSSPAPYTARRIQGIDLPRSVQFTYYSRALDHNTFTQIAELHTFDEGQDVVIAVPFTLPDDEAKRIAETTLVNSHIEQQEFVFTTDYNNIDLEPGDIVVIPFGDGDQTAQVRIKEINETEDGLLEFKTSRSDYNTQSYEYSGISTSAPPEQTTNVPTTLGLSDTLFVDVPALNASDDKPRIYAAIHGFARPGWPGAALYQSTDNGNTYSPVAQSSMTVTMGMVSTPTPAPVKGYYVWDDTTEITVVLKQGKLDTLTDIAVLNGQNWAMLGQELIGFVNAQLIAPNTYKLSRLLRGRRGTEPKCGTHLTNELFVVIDGALTALPYSKDAINKLTKFKTVTLGSSLDLAEAVDIQPTALNMLPYAPGNVKIVKQGDDFVFTWIERPRLNNGLQDDRELVHDPDWAGYGITIFADVNKDSVKRSAIEVVTTYTYTKAMQIEDFGAPQTQLYASVVQMSGIAGGGYPAVVSA